MPTIFFFKAKVTASGHKGVDDWEEVYLNKWKECRAVSDDGVPVSKLYMMADYLERAHWCQVVDPFLLKRRAGPQQVVDVGLCIPGDENWTPRAWICVSKQATSELQQEWWPPRKSNLRGARPGVRVTAYGGMRTFVRHQRCFFHIRSFVALSTSRSRGNGEVGPVCGSQNPHCFRSREGSCGIHWVLICCGMRATRGWISWRISGLWLTHCNSCVTWRASVQMWGEWEWWLQSKGPLE